MGETMSILPEAAQHEHVSQLMQAADILKTSGYQGELCMTGHPDLPDAPKLLIPVLNIHLQPDFYIANSSAGRGLVGFIPSISCLSDEICSERWRDAKRWADDHQADLLVLAPADRLDRAREIAAKWKLDPQIVQPLH